MMKIRFLQGITWRLKDEVYNVVIALLDRVAWPDNECFLVYPPIGNMAGKHLMFPGLSTFGKHG